MADACEQCGSPFPEDLPEKVCPRCLAASTLLGDDNQWLSEAELSADVRDTIGRYHLLERIGEGGFGDVYRARQLEPINRLVALKVIKPGMDTREVIARFEAERQALAMFDHPGIARVLDAGETERGLPFFVMELVTDGEPITAYCQSHHLKNQEKLALAHKTCLAVQHAHERGIIHRDLKPSNILVCEIDGVPQPKVIDFGIAKATTRTLSDRTVFTHSKQLLGTPEYMSPEQAASNGLDVDARTDVYALGILMVELLTGTTRPDRESLARLPYDDMITSLRRREAVGPSDLSDEMFDPDIDQICSKATAQDRSRRYQSAQELGNDLEAFLRGDRLALSSIGQRKPYHASRWIAVVAVFLIVCSFFLRHPPGDGLEEFVPGLPEIPFSLAEHTSFPDEVALTCRQLRDRPEDTKAQKRLLFLLNGGFYPPRAGPPMPHGGYVHQLEWSDRETRFVLSASQDGMLRKWEPSTGEVVNMASAGSSIVCMAILIDNRRVAISTVQGLVHLWDLNTFQPVGSAFQCDEMARELVFSEDGHTLIGSTYSGSLYGWDVDEYRERWRTTCRFHPAISALIPSGKHVYVGGTGSAIAVYECTTGKLVNEIALGEAPKKLVHSKPHNRIYWGGNAGSVGAWDMQSLSEIYRKRPHKDNIYAIRLSPDGSRLASASKDRTACILDAATGEKVHEIRHGHEVYNLIFSLGGEWLVTGSKDHTVRIWNMRENRPLCAPLALPKTHAHLLINRAGNQLIAGGSWSEAGSWRFDVSPDLLQHSGAFPEWFLQFIEAYVGRRLKVNEAASEEVPWLEFEDLSRRLADDSPKPEHLYRWAEARFVKPN